MKMPDLITRRPTPSLEVALEGLRALGVGPDRIDIVPVGPLEGYKGPIIDQDPEPGEEVEDWHRIVLFVRDYGLADRLPYGVLEPVEGPRDAADRLIEIGRYEYWKKYLEQFSVGRRLVLAIDHEHCALAASIARHRSSLLPIGTDASFSEALVSLFDLDELELDADEVKLMAARLYSWPDQKGPLSALTELLETFLDLDVETRSGPGVWIEIPEARRSKLGAAGARIGESVTMGAGYREPTPSIRIEFGPVDVRMHRRLDSDPKWWARIEKLCELCLPAGQTPALQLLLRKEDRRALLGDPLHGRLGRTTYLGAA